MRAEGESRILSKGFLSWNQKCFQNSESQKSVPYWNVRQDRIRRAEMMTERDLWAWSSFLWVWTWDLGGSAHFDGWQFEDAQLAAQFPLAHWCPDKKGTKPWTNRGTYFLFHENCMSAFSLPESLSQSVSRAQPLALGQLARFHLSLEFEICHVLTFSAKRLRSAHVQNPPSLNFAQLPSLHKVLPQFFMESSWT